MLVHITRGLGTHKDKVILVATIAAGVVLLALGVLAIRKMHAPKGVPATVLPPEEVLALAEKARGPMPEISYVANDMAKVASFAVAKRTDGVWRGLPAGTVLQVLAVNVEEGETWIRGRVQGGVREEEVTVHGSFLERYLPLVLDRTIEFSDMRLIHASEVPPRMSVTGWLRNITTNALSQVVVACVFQDKDGREVDVQRSAELVLPAGELVRFETDATDKERIIRSISVQITHATPDGLRNYLSTVVVQKAALGP